MKKDLKIGSEIINLRLVENAIDILSGELEIGSDDYGKILIATVEAVNNAIVHGNKADNRKFVFVEFETSENNLLITVRDEGKGFMPEFVPDPTAPENIENLSGRGVFLMRKLCDDISFNDIGNEVVMEFKIR